MLSSLKDVAALYVVSRSRGSKVPQALLGPDLSSALSNVLAWYCKTRNEHL